MLHNISQLQTFDNKKLFIQEFSPENRSKAVIVLIHGIGEHSSRYQNWAEKFTNEGFVLIAYDQRGHGLSDGSRGVISSYSDFMNDIDLVLKEAKKRYTNLPVILYGHSMGGGEVLFHLQNRKSDYLAVVSTSPWIITREAPSKFIISFLKFLNKLIPKLSIKTKFKTSKLSHDSRIVKRYEEDELVHNKISLRLFIAAYDAGYSIYNSAKTIKKPTLLLHGAQDKITDPKASRHFADNNKENCTFKLWEEGYHELHNETFSDKVFIFICDWINQQLNK